jgi:hypothetical protein
VRGSLLHDVSKLAFDNYLEVTRFLGCNIGGFKVLSAQDFTSSWEMDSVNHAAVFFFLVLTTDGIDSTFSVFLYSWSSAKDSISEIAALDR